MKAALALVAAIAVGITGMGRLFAAEATPSALRPCVVLTGADSLVKSPGYVRVESEKEWASVWHHHKGVEETKEHDAFFNPLGLPGIDFDRYMVIAVFCGSGWNSAGVTVASLTEERERLLLRFQGKWYQTAGPDGGGRPACAYGFLVLPRTEKTVVLEENVQHLIGGPPVWKERASLAQGRPRSATRPTSTAESQAGAIECILSHILLIPGRYMRSAERQHSCAASRETRRAHKQSSAVAPGEGATACGSRAHR